VAQIPVLTQPAFRLRARRLAGADPCLGTIVATHGLPRFWAREPGFGALVLLILEQQVSLASARAAFDRLLALGPLTPGSLLTRDDDTLRRAGFSRQKRGYVRALAAAVGGGFDLPGLTRLADDEVRRRLTALPGIGPWTADVYLLACLRRPDVWPVGDRALRVAAGEVLGLPATPTMAELEEIGGRWRPHRSVAARLLWHSYLSQRSRV
jgi:DNA-3-methyladenine glycosylase II